MKLNDLYARVTAERGKMMTWWRNYLNHLKMVCKIVQIDRKIA
jgi:hypothetical protein